jgi:hypothetical protein
MGFKTHFPPPLLPVRPDVRYIVPVRTVDDVAVSLFHFVNSHLDSFRKYWGSPPRFDSLQVFVDKFILGNKQYWQFVKAWWAHRHEPNVLLVHFADMKRDLPAAIDRIAHFLQIELDDETRDRVIRHSSFEWMKQHQSKFEAGADSKIRAIASGCMLRQGQVGGGAVVLSAEQQQALDAESRRQFDDELYQFATNAVPFQPLVC